RRALPPRKDLTRLGEDHRGGAELARDKTGDPPGGGEGVRHDVPVPDAGAERRPPGVDPLEDDPRVEQPRLQERGILPEAVARFPEEKVLRDEVPHPHGDRMVHGDSTPCPKGEKTGGAAGATACPPRTNR